jgi:hypothetical protein
MLLEALGNSLNAIKKEDAATDGDLGAVLGKSEDQAAKYRAGLAEMGVVSFLRACREWDGRFANEVLALVGMKLSPLEAGELSDQASVTALLSLAMALSAEIEKDHGRVGDAHLAQHRALIERVGHIIDGYRERLKLRSVA